MIRENVKEDMLRLRAETDAFLDEKRAAGYECVPVRLPASLRSQPGCRGCGRDEDQGDTVYGICRLTRHLEDKKVMLFSFLALCKECVEDDETRERMAGIIFDQGKLETLQ